MADAKVKSEHGVKSEPGVKPEPGGSPPMMDEDEDGMYEDAGDLEFYDKQAANNAYGSVYLARIPKYVWEAWDSIDDDEEIQIGQMRYWSENNQPRMQLLLDSDRPEHKDLPKEYQLDISAADVNNTFIFTEEDLPGFKAKSRARAEAAAAGIPAALLARREAEAKEAREAAEGKTEKKPAFQKNKRWQPYYRKAIPKKTRVFGKIKYEITGQPLQNEESDKLLRARAELAMKPKAEVKRFVPELQKRIIQAGTARAANWGSSLTKTNMPKPANKKKPEVLKAARIPKNQLLDLLFQCFKQYEYWSVKALRQQVQQPEAYLRETLDEIAVLNKSGSFANLWSLKQHYKQMQPQAAAVQGPAPDDVDDDDDDDVEEMEDVIIS